MTNGMYAGAPRWLLSGALAVLGLCGACDDPVTPYPDLGFARPDMALPPPPPGPDMPPPPDGMMMGDMAAMGPKMCTVVADCTGACPPASKGCTCSTNPMGMKICVPTCTVPADCPPGMNGQVLTCTQGICVPPM